MSCGCGKSDENDLRAQTLDLAGLVEYQDGAVVSRTVLDKPTGTITVFAFDKGQSLSEHTAPFDATVQLLDGKGDFNIEGKTFTLKQGEMLIMPADRPHSVTATERFKMMLIMIRS